MKSILIALTLFAGSVIASAQMSQQPWRVEATLTGGIGLSNFSELRSAVSPDELVYSPTVMARVMWHPGNLVSVGLASGYVGFSSERFQFGTEGGRSIEHIDAELQGVPVHFAFSMQQWGAELGAGVGPYFMSSRVQASDQGTSSGSRIELGVSSWLAYNFQVTDRFFIGPELSMHFLSYRGILTLAPQVRFRYDIAVY
jgi:hypothetical protein